MGRVIVEYNPPLTIESQRLIRNNITPSMISNDETSSQYEISMVADILLEHEFMHDVHKVNNLIIEGVDYIEF